MIGRGPKELAFVTGHTRANRPAALVHAHASVEAVAEKRVARVDARIVGQFAVSSGESRRAGAERVSRSHLAAAAIQTHVFVAAILFDLQFASPSAESERALAEVVAELKLPLVVPFIRSSTYLIDANAVVLALQLARCALVVVLLAIDAGGSLVALAAIAGGQVDALAAAIAGLGVESTRTEVVLVDVAFSACNASITLVRHPIAADLWPRLCALLSH